MFEGFPQDLPDFMWGLALNNEKPWFDAHREDYERCLQKPFRELAFEVADAVEEKWPDHAPALHISRINRDARRLFGRGPYKDHLWFSLAKTSGVYDIQPSFWFEIGATACSYGMGFWMASGGAAERWREKIDADPVRLERIVKKFNKQKEFTLEGEKYKKPKGDPGELLFDWYNSRWIHFEKKEWFDPAPPGREIVGRILQSYEILMPVYDYMCTV